MLGSASGSSTNSGSKSVSVQSSSSGSKAASVSSTVKPGSSDSKTSVNTGIVGGVEDLNFITL